MASVEGDFVAKHTVHRQVNLLHDACELLRLADELERLPAVCSLSDVQLEAIARGWVE